MQYRLVGLIQLIQLKQLILERVGDRNNDNLLVVYNCPKGKEIGTNAVDNL